jgi:hypothetical protein
MTHQSGASGNSADVEDQRRTRARVAMGAGVATVLALAVLLWQVWAQSQASKPGAVSVPAGPLAGSDPNQEEHKMLQYIREHPELARQRVPHSSP